jgi:hypothetical protein
LNAVAEQLAPLVKEYAEKLDHLVESVTRSMSVNKGWFGGIDIVAAKDDLPEVQRHWQMWKRLRPQLKSLIQQSSQVIEHGQLSEVAHLALGLRLAELEQAFQTAGNLFAPVEAEEQRKLANGDGRTSHPDNSR